jgi:hypothetical protein
MRSWSSPRRWILVLAKNTPGQAIRFQAGAPPSSLSPPSPSRGATCRCLRLTTIDSPTITRQSDGHCSRKLPFHYPATIDELDDYGPDHFSFPEDSWSCVGRRYLSSPSSMRSSRRWTTMRSPSALQTATSPAGAAGLLYTVLTWAFNVASAREIGGLLRRRFGPGRP